MNDGWFFVGLSCIGIMMLQGSLWYLGIGMIISGIYFAEKDLFDNDLLFWIKKEAKKK